MRRIFTYLFVIIALMYTAGWFFIANTIEKDIHNLLDSLKEEHKIKKYSTGISVSGFPFSLNVKFDSPSVSFISQEDAADFNIKLDGTIHVKAGLFSKSLVVTTLGNLSFKGHIENYKFDIISEGDRISSYKLNFVGKPISPFFINKVLSVVKSATPNYLQLIEGFDIDIKSFVVRDQIQNKNLIEATRLALNLNGDIFSKKIDVSGSELIDRLRFSEDSMIVWHYLQKISVIRNLVKSLGPDINHYLEVFTLPKLGIMNYAIDFNYVGDKSSQKIHFSQLSIRDNLYVIDAKGKISLVNDDVNLDLKSTVLFSDLWHSLMQGYLNNLGYNKKFKHLDFGNESILGLILSPIINFFNSIFNSSSGHGKYLPQLNLVGPIKTKVALSYKVLQENVFDLTIKDLSINTRAYFIDLHGNLKHFPNKDIYDIKATLGNYSVIVDQVVEYVNKISNVGGIHLPILGSSKTIPGNLIEKIKKFIRSVSDDPASQSKDVNLTIISKGDSIYPAVGRYSSVEFKQAWQMFVASVIIDKVTEGVDRFLKKGVGKSLENALQGNVVGSVKDIAEGVFGLLS